MRLPAVTLVDDQSGNCALAWRKSSLKDLACSKHVVMTDSRQPIGASIHRASLGEK